MPRSKRARVVHLSKVDKKGKELTLKTFANIQESVEKYPYLYVFSVDNMRNTYLKDVRTQLSDSRLFFGKTKVMAKALGSDPSTAPAPNTHLLTPYLTGSVGLLFSPRDPAAIQTFFSGFRPLDFARAGTISTRMFTVPAGIVYSSAGEIPQEHDIPLAGSMEPMLRKLGVPSSMGKGRSLGGKVVLENDHVVCKEGEMLSSAQTSLLKMFGVASAEFKVQLLAVWSAVDEEVKELEGGEAMEVEVVGDGEGVGEEVQSP